jgi:hypothetical protein
MRSLIEVLRYSGNEKEFYINANMSYFTNPVHENQLKTP